MPKYRVPSMIVILLLAALACQVPTVPGAPQPSPVPTMTVAPGALIFEEDFSDPNSGFDRRAAAEGIMDYNSGSYRIIANVPQTNFWSTAKRDLADVRLEVDEGKLAGPDENRVGLICRYTKGNYYFFLISHDGFYAIGLFQDGQTSLLGQSEMQTHEIINRGTNVNHLRADCVGSTLTFYVNGQRVAQVEDATLTHGDIGLLAGSFSQPGVDILFDNFVAIQP
ncbi:MAG: hypothetical protein ACOY0R_19950 [Chloroflexota bacterium]